MGLFKKLFGEETSKQCVEAGGPKETQKELVESKGPEEEENFREQLTRALIEEYGTTEVSERAKSVLEACLRGDVEAMESLAIFENRGEDYDDDLACIPKDCMKAARWWKRVAELSNDAKAHFYYGDIMFNGTEDSDLKSKHEGLMHLRIAADLGWSRAQYKMGLAYEYGTYVKEDEREAFRYYLRAAEGGEADAMYCVSLCYACGEGIAQDDFKALYWNKKYVDAGSGAIHYPPQAEHIEMASRFVEYRRPRKVTIRRAKRSVGSSIVYLIFLDGELHAQVPNGATISFEIAEGAHRIYAESNLLGKYANSFETDRSKIIAIPDGENDICFDMDIKRSRLLFEMV